MKNLFNYTEENPLIIEDYPYGFTLRTQMRAYIESAPKKGDRYCTQTLNPKNGRWNKVKKSTYSSILVMFEDENGHIKTKGVNVYSGADKIKEFINDIGGVEKLNPLQLKVYNESQGIREVEVDEFTGQKVKDHSFRWRKFSDGKIRALDLVFNRTDGVTPKEMFQAIKGMNQDKLKDVFDLGLKVGVFVRGGRTLGNITENGYNDFLASDYSLEMDENGN